MDIVFEEKSGAAGVVIRHVPHFYYYVADVFICSQNVFCFSRKIYFPVSHCFFCISTSVSFLHCCVPLERKFHCWLGVNL